MIDWCDEEFKFWPKNINLTPREEKWLEDKVMKIFKRLTQTGLVPYFLASMMKQENKSAPCPYDSVQFLTLLHTYRCSNQFEHIYSISGCIEDVDSRL